MRCILGCYPRQAGPLPKGIKLNLWFVIQIHLRTDFFSIFEIKTKLLSNDQ